MERFTGSGGLLNSMYRQNCVRMTEFGKALARSVSPFVDPLQITLDHHGTRLHRDVLDAADVGFYRRSIVGRQFLMTDQCRKISLSV
jgi:hypothetical protein